MAARKSPAVFLDRDGVIIIEKNFHCDSESIEFIPGSIEALQLLSRSFLTIVVSNQSGVARGYFSEDDVRKFQSVLDHKMRQLNIAISGWYFCPHGPDDTCECRKPRPGMIFRAADKLHIDLDASWMVGDKSSDIAAGQAAGLKTILLKTGYAGLEPGAMDVKPHYIADDLFAAVDIINKENTASAN